MLALLTKLISHFIGLLDSALRMLLCCRLVTRALLEQVADVPWVTMLSMPRLR